MEFSDVVRYFGSQGRYSHLILKSLPEGITSYTDITAGSCGVPFEIRQERHIPVAVNDRNFFSYLLGMTFIAGHGSRHGICSPDIGDIPRIDGYSTSKGIFEYELARTIDGIALTFQMTPRRLAALGIAIVQSSKDARFISRETVTVHPEDLLTTFSNIDVGISILLSGCTSAHLGGAFNYDAETYLTMTEGDPEGAIYMDPAWPWLDGRPCLEGYNDYTHVLSSILKQAEVPSQTFWSAEDVLPELKRWLDICLEKYRWILVSTQSTNAPPVPEVLSFLLSYGKVEEFSFETQGTTLGDTFVDYVFRLGE